MAEIESMPAGTDFPALINALADDALVAQQIVQQGAIHAISSLISMGCTEENAISMLADLRKQMGHIRTESIRRGITQLFDTDQTAFQ